MAEGIRIMDRLPHASECHSFRVKGLYGKDRIMKGHQVFSPYRIGSILGARGFSGACLGRQVPTSIFIGIGWSIGGLITMGSKPKFSGFHHA
jgi:hypothetical protein